MATADRGTTVGTVRTAGPGTYLDVGRRAGGGFPRAVLGHPVQPAGYGTEECLARYRAHVLSSPALVGRLHLLRGQRLGCWCCDGDALEPSPMQCHAQVLAELADGPLGDPPGTPPPTVGRGETFSVLTVH